MISLAHGFAADAQVDLGQNRTLRRSNPGNASRETI
jgi:hypothetical protein